MVRAMVDPTDIRTISGIRGMRCSVLRIRATEMIRDQGLTKIGPEEDEIIRWNQREK